MFRHAERDNVCPAGFQNAGHHRIAPIIIVCKTPQGGLQPTQHHRYIRVCLLCQACVYRSASVWPPACHTAGRILVARAAHLGHGIMSHHAVHIAAANEKAIARAAVFFHALAGVICRLADDANTPALLFQQARNDGRAERGVVYIGIAHHHHKIHILPAAGQHIGPADGKKLLVHKHPFCVCFKTGG